MSSHSQPSPDSILEQSLPELIRRETAQRWTQRWVGQRIDCYRVEELIGTGTYGVVFRACRTTLYERDVAIKLLPNLQGQTKAKQFQNECQALADLDHPHIAQILTAGVTDDGTPYLIMPLLSGIPVDDYVQHRNLDWSQMAELARQLAAAMAFAHEQGVVHCDLKPDNILVDENHHLTVTDFGLAVRIDDLADLAQRPSWSPGTIGYAAPEILTSRQDASSLVDVYSLGAVLYRLLTGKPPHQSSGWLDALVATLETRSEPVRSRNPQVPEALAEICDRCLSQQPQDRFESAADIEHRLTLFLQSQNDPPPSRKRRLSVLISIVMLGILASAVASMLLFWPDQAGASLDSNEQRAANLKPLSEQQVDWILAGIEEQLLQPGLKYPAKTGDYEETFDVLKDATQELESLLALAPNHKEVRHRTATGLFLLGRAAHWVNQGEYAIRRLKRSEQMFRELNQDYPDDRFMFDVFHTLIVQATLAPPGETIELHLSALEIVEALLATDPENLDYADAHACMYVYLAEDHLREANPSPQDLEQAKSYALRAREIAQWTCDQPGSLPLHRKHIMNATSALGEIARQQGDIQKALEFTKVARDEAIRFDLTMRIVDSKQHLYGKSRRYAVALRDAEHLEEARVMAAEVQDIARQLEELDFSDATLYGEWAIELKQSIEELQQ